MGEIYALAPGNKPRSAEEIAEGIVTNFKKHCKQMGDFFYHEMELRDVKAFINNTLLPIEKFRELNLSNNEYQNGTSVEDESRPTIQFVSMYSYIPEDDDFVDLEACTQNIFSHIEQDAFEEWKGETDIDELQQFRQIYMER